MNRFQDTFEFEGVWWFPQNSERKIPGILRHSPKEINLHLMGTLSDLTTFQNQFEYEIILGLTTKGESITLYKCYGVNFSMSHPQFATSDYTVLSFFKGIHFLTKDEIKFSQLFTHLTNFDEWIGVSGFYSDADKINEGKFSISYSQPKEITFDIDEDYLISIWFGYSMNFESMGEKEQGIKQRISLNIKSKSDKSFFNLQERLSDIRKFLGLAIAYPVYPIEVSGLTESNKQIVENQTIQPSIQIYFQQANMPDKIKDIHSMNMLFAYRDIAHNPAHYFRTWFKNKPVLEPIYNLYSEIHYNKHTPLDQKFLHLIHALESYHRRTSNETESDEQTHKHRIKTILSAIPEEYREWLKNELNFSNELSLRQRLTLLLDTFPFILENYTNEKKEFINFIVDTRNYLTHYTNEAKNNIQDLTKLYEICLRMELLIESCLLFTLGFENDKIRSLIQRGKRLKGINDKQT